MTWNNIYGQHRVKEILQRLIIENRIPHAICMYGSEGIGKEALALEFARTINCLEPVEEGGHISSCGKCRSCKKLDKLSHDNLLLIFPLPTPLNAGSSKSESVLSKLSDPQIKSVQDQVALKAKDHYHKIAVENANMIKISSIREVKRSLTLSSAATGRRCVLVFEAEKMNSEAANAFLKTLEEPHDKITIFLITSRPEMILPTILSRCQKIRCEPLSDEIITQILIEKHGIDEQEAKLISVFAQGSVSRAESFLDESMKELRQKVIGILRTALRKRIYRIDLLKELDEFIKSKDKRKNETFLNLMIIWLRDALVIAQTGYTDSIINTDQKDTIKKFAQNFSESDIPLAIEKIEKAITQIYRNVQIQLIFINLFLELRKIFLGKTL
jgi:DNA polymerase III subunit delta'